MVGESYERMAEAGSDGVFEYRGTYYKSEEELKEMKKPM